MIKNKKQELLPLKLMAKSAEDLKVMSACMQDALVPISGVHFDSSNKRLNMFAHRYRWENHHLQPERPHGERIHSGVSFENVEKVQYAGFDPKKELQNSLYLLALKHLPPYIEMTFAKDAQIRLKTSDLKVKLKDSIHMPSWPSLKPSHSG